MKKAGLIAASVLAATLASSPLLAQDQETTPMPTDHSAIGGAVEPGKYKDMMMKRQKMHEEMMGMMKDTMTILRNMKNAPTAAQKQKLDAMIKRMDAMMMEQKDTMKQMKEEWEKTKQAPTEMKEQMKEEMKEKMNKQIEGY